MLRKFRVKINGKEYLVEMEEIGGMPQVAQQQVAVPTAQPHPVAPAPTVSSGSGEKVVAPMPGNILDVKVVVGQKVDVDQVLVILEAMKMENEIVAPVSGTVTSVAVSKGQAIDVGELIVSIE